jgi:hypothetical protein
MASSLETSDVLGVDRAFPGDDIPAAVGALVGFDHLRMRVVNACRLWEYAA